MSPRVDPLGDGFAVRQLAVGSVSTVPIHPESPVDVIPHLC
jgi:hypothetical protein